MCDAFGSDRRQAESEPLQHCDRVTKRRLGGANVSEDVAVLAEGTGETLMLKGMQQHHLTSDEGPRGCQLLGQVEDDVPQLVNG